MGDHRGTLWSEAGKAPPAAKGSRERPEEGRVLVSPRVSSASPQSSYQRQHFILDHVTVMARVMLKH